LSRRTLLGKSLTMFAHRVGEQAANRWRKQMEQRSTILGTLGAMQREDFSFNPPAWTGAPRQIAELWRLTKDGKVGHCQLQNHPTRKGEIRCFADAEIWKTKAENDPLAVRAGRELEGSVRREGMDGMSNQPREWDVFEVHNAEGKKWMPVRCFVVRHPEGFELRSARGKKVTVEFRQHILQSILERAAYLKQAALHERMTVVNERACGVCADGFVCEDHPGSR
jgi:hypothetical protein